MTIIYTDTPAHITPLQHKVGSIALIALIAVVLATVWIGMGTQPLIAQSGDEPTQPLRVVVMPLEPFVIVDGDYYRGFTIDLLEALTANMGLTYTLELTPTVQAQLETIQKHDADLAMTGISITKEREAEVDFSLPYFTAGLQILTSAHDVGVWDVAVEATRSLLLSTDFLAILAVLAVLIVLLGHLFWLVERRKNSEFPMPYVAGVWEGIWYTVVTLVTVGYGDRTAKTVAGRLITMFWMFLGVVLVAIFTGIVASHVTLRGIEGRIDAEHDLAGKRIATVANTTASQYLDNRRLPYRAVEEIHEAYELLEQDEIDAIVYDSPVLLYYATGEGQGKVEVVGSAFQRRYYGVAFPEGSPLPDTINQTLLELIEDGTYDAIYQRWFGKNEAGL